MQVADLSNVTCIPTRQNATEIRDFHLFQILFLHSFVTCPKIHYQHFVLRVRTDFVYHLVLIILSKTQKKREREGEEGEEGRREGGGGGEEKTVTRNLFLLLKKKEKKAESKKKWKSIWNLKSQQKKTKSWL